MDPLTIGTAIAILAGTKLVEKVGSEAGEAGWGLANKMIGKVRGLFSASDNDKALEKLDAVEAANEPNSDDIDELAALIADELSEAGRVAGQLAPMVEAARKDSELAELLHDADEVERRAGSIVITQNVTGHGNVVLGHTGGDVNVTR